MATAQLFIFANIFLLVSDHRTNVKLDCHICFTLLSFIRARLEWPRVIELSWKGLSFPNPAAFDKLFSSCTTDFALVFKITLRRSSKSTKMCWHASCQDVPHAKLTCAPRSWLACSQSPYLSLGVCSFEGRSVAWGWQWVAGGEKRADNWARCMSSSCSQMTGAVTGCVFLLRLVSQAHFDRMRVIKCIFSSSNHQQTPKITYWWTVLAPLFKLCYFSSLCSDGDYF